MSQPPESAPKLPENPIVLAPATVEACADDLRTPREQVMAMADAAAQRGCIGQGGAR
ncbi:MAG: hypothetical protein HOV70_20125 [Streptomyces sp.]|nr:hypothetical protein [Streptomyces sp.]